jgi:hypothetical protein
VGDGGGFGVRREGEAAMAALRRMGQDEARCMSR